VKTRSLNKLGIMSRRFSYSDRLRLGLEIGKQKKYLNNRMFDRGIRELKNFFYPKPTINSLQCTTLFFEWIITRNSRTN